MKGGHLGRIISVPGILKGASLVPLLKYVFLDVEKTIVGSLLCCGVAVYKESGVR